MTWANKEFEFCLHRHTLVVCRGHGFASFCCLHPRTAHEGHLWQMGLARDARRHIASKSPKKPHHTVLGKQSSLPPPSVVSDSKQHHRWSKFFSSNNKKILKPTTFPDYPPPENDLPPRPLAHPSWGLPGLGGSSRRAAKSSASAWWTGSRRAISRRTRSPACGTSPRPRVGGRPEASCGRGRVAYETPGSM